MTSFRKRYENDQTRLIDLLRRVQDAKEISLSRTQRAFAEFKRQIEKHIASEEQVFFPRFETNNGLIEEGPTAVMRVEHRQIRRLLTEIGEKLRKGDLTTDAEQVVLLDFLLVHQQHERAVVYSTMNEPRGAGKSPTDRCETVPVPGPSNPTHVDRP